MNTLGQAHNQLYERLQRHYLVMKKDGIACPDAKYFTWPFAQLFVARNIKVLYCPIAKNACSSLKRLLVELSDIPAKQKVLEGDIHGNTDGNFTGIQLKDLGAEQIEEALHSDHYLRFAVIREPFSRLLSAYWEKFVVNRTEPAVLGDTVPVIEAIRQKTARQSITVDSGISFDDFVRYVICSEPRELNAHWTPQYTYLEDIDYNAFYALDDMRGLYLELGRRAGRPVTSPGLNVTNSGKGRAVPGAALMRPSELLNQGPIDLDSFYDAELRALVREYYAADFQLLEQCVRSDGPGVTPRITPVSGSLEK